ncbi:MFS transporter, partial [Pseudomonas coronafaciens]
MNRVLLAALILGVSIVGLSIGSTVPVVALRLYQAGASNVHIGIMSALPAAGMMLSAFIVERLCKHLSRRHIYLYCFSLSTLSIAALEVLPSSLAILAVARLTMGLAAGTIIILGESWVNEIAMDSYRGRIVAIYTTCFTVFQLLGPAMVSVFGTAGAQVNGVVIAGHFVALAVIWFILPSHMTGPGDSKDKTFSVLGFIQVAPALCMGII